MRRCVLPDFMTKISLSCLLLSCLLAACQSVSREYRAQKIDGVCFVAPRDSIPQQAMASIREVNADWVAIVPYAFLRENDPTVIYDTTSQWWGETGRGLEQTLSYARQLGLKIMLKPHVWVQGQGWPGDYTLETEEEWQQWEASYENYLDAMTALAIRYEVGLFCIGTEFRVAARERPAYWRRLISKIRQTYTGPLTYAANWDNYQNISFWDELDYIGIDAYFPLSERRDPSLRQLMDGWEEPMEQIEEFQEQYHLPVLFTEYGYRSADYSGRGHWLNEKEGLVTNMQAQATAYEALFRTVWQQDWFAGGFAWKWYATVPRNSRWNRWETDFTPQEKPAAEVLRRYYTQNTQADRRQ